MLTTASITVYNLALASLCSCSDCSSKTHGHKWKPSVPAMLLGFHLLSYLLGAMLYLLTLASLPDMRSILATHSGAYCLFWLPDVLEIPSLLICCIPLPSIMFPFEITNFLNVTCLDILYLWVIGNDLMPLPQILFSCIHALPLHNTFSFYLTIFFLSVSVSNLNKYLLPVSLITFFPIF